MILLQEAVNGTDIDDGPPKATEINNQELLPKRTCKKTEFIARFLKKHVPSEKLEKDDTLNILKHKVHPLYGKKHKTFILKSTRKKTLTSKQKRELKVYSIDEKQQRYEYFIPLHSLWTDYIKDLIQFDKITEKNVADVEQKLLKADYHGSILEVEKSKCSSLTGQKGIMFQETKNTWKIIREDNQVKTIPKQNTVINIDVGGYRLTIHGSNFKYKTSERSSRKFKGHLSIDM